MKEIRYQMEKRYDKRSDTVWIFFMLWGASIVSFAIVLALALFTLGSGLLYLIHSSGKAVIPPSQDIPLLLTFLPYVLLFSPYPALIAAIVLTLRNRYRHLPYRNEQGKLPIYRVQEAVIRTNLDLRNSFSLCIKALDSLNQDECRILEKSLEAGTITAIVKIKKLGRKGETIQFQLRMLSSEEIEIKITSSSNVLIKGMDYAKNIKNIYEICDFLKQEILNEGSEVHICLP